MALSEEETRKINHSFYGNKIYLTDNDFIINNLRLGEEENLFVRLIYFLDFSFYFPAFYSTLSIFILFLDMPNKYILFFLTALFLYLYGVYKSYTSLNMLDIGLYSIYYLFAKYRILITVIIIVTLIVFKLYLAIPAFLLAKTIGFIFGLFLSEPVTNAYRKKFGLSLLNGDFFILSNLDRYSDNPILGFKGYLKKYLQFISDNECNPDSKD